MRLDDRARDVETKPSARNRSTARVRRTEEPLEQMQLIVLGDADSRIGNLEPHRVAVAVAVQTHFHASAFGRELDRIAEQIVEQLEHSAAVRGHHQSVVRLSGQPDRLRGRTR